MLPITLERIEKQLIRWGYPSHLVENMKPWSLISCYANEKRKREEKLTTEHYKGKAIMDTDVKSRKSEKGAKKYQGVKVPYRNR
ncbi:MAG: hypothetical protein A4E52_00314 [Pelotomaculum sp. PtaB.Bin013]|uniref:Uncharacterized protein n=1 Tax=Pelotomaculum isophthalicicum JI TaxID=947010 RepID=A0A9X4JTU9_9FIRM|nr:hypothetical protein [Pelotomaculum isophthalicicum]MDF9409339.1 hypothetical protein [Pelotomaculum isophthalicicum JI]OPX91836.1 MAG: hypothetical protein A4E52_00314 [Pelotomaculum sp. PtaB.Bin013]